MPLSELNVLEFASVLAGPSVGMFFAEFGARVVKVENFRAGGNVTRSWRLPEEEGADLSSYFSCVNWGKESIGLDLRQASGQAIAHELARRADVVLVSFKAGDAEKFGLDYSTLANLNPRLVYGEITAYGPGDRRTGYDAVIQAESGFTYLNGDPDGGPTKMPVALMDVLAAHQLKEGCLVALLERQRTGRGTYVSVSLARSGISALINQGSNWLQAGVSPQRLGSGHPNIVPYGSSWPTADDRHIVLAVGNDRQFSALCRVLGLDLSDDDRFATNPARVRHRAELETLLRPAIQTRDRDELLKALQPAGVPAGPIRDIPDALATPAAAPMILASGAARGVRGVALEPSEMYRPADLPPPPALGAHTELVLQTLGFDDARIEELKLAGVVTGRGSVNPKADTGSS